MKFFIRSFSYIFHPLFMPLVGVLLYFYISPRYFNPEFLYSKVFATVIMTTVIPILSYFMLKNLQLVTTIHLKEVKERRWPLLLQMLFTFILIRLIFDGYEIPELYYFFVGILGASTGAFLLALLKFKASLHMIALSGVLFFVVGLSLHFGINLLLLIAGFIFACGATATSRLDMRAHTPAELVVGFIVGAVSQFMVYSYWI
ncbi:hypothetical protein [Dokdonia donghaensis]|uniref:Membrane protein n=2 Tax=Dokdonia TaxID=326319 RepID=A0A0A2GT35_9FLAO|nr:hypothetical protein [Dokdonia donghaensis]ANH61785.1 hypothetical protein I597_2894 [Dokdonia donghaensis DSW-1]KGO06367.1 membrane protein [Dokdonia donghaensis DSW-1]